jgi:hypothetical protein
MGVSTIPGVWGHLTFNLLLQIFDGVLTYQVVSAGVPEANPLVHNTMTELGLVWGLVYSKSFACILLFAIFVITQTRQNLAIRAFTVTAAVYGAVSFTALCAMSQQFLR